MFDIIIYNATIVDGSGRPPFRGFVGIRNEKIADIVVAQEVVSQPPADAKYAIDAKGQLLTPGFVDVHGHSDINILACLEGESKLRQGITTELVGNCGESAFPLFGPFRQSTMVELQRLGIEPRWQTAQQYFAFLDAQKPAYNIASYVGHGSVRAAVVGYGSEPPTPTEMRQMKREIAEAMASGAIGMSTGLIYPPGIFSTTEELIELQAEAQRFGGIYASHVRSEGDLLLQAADEFLSIVCSTSSQGQFSHLKASGPRNWGKVELVIDAIESAVEQGMGIWWDKYPYVASSTSLSSLLPAWVLAGGREATLGRLQDRTLRDEILSEVERTNEGRDGWDSVLIVDAASEPWAHLHGLTVGEAARELSRDPGHVFFDLLIGSDLRASICNFTMNWDETDRAITHPRGLVCTDAACRATTGVLSHDCPHPRAYGTFGAFFRRYVKELKRLPLEEAVRKVTADPCEVFGIASRGRIQKDYYADLLIINWDDFRDVAEFRAPHQHCTGIETIIVNGVLTYHRGQMTGRRGGRVLRKNGDAII